MYPCCQDQITCWLRAADIQLQVHLVLLLTWQLAHILYVILLAWLKPQSIFLRAQCCPMEHFPFDLCLLTCINPFLPVALQDVLIRRWPHPSIPCQYYRAMDPEMPLCIGPCRHTYEQDDLEMHILEKGLAPFGIKSDLATSEDAEAELTNPLAASRQQPAAIPAMDTVPTSSAAPAEDDVLVQYSKLQAAA